MRSVDGREVVWEPQPRQAVALSCPALELCYGGTKGGGKLLDVDEPIPTPTSWKRNGDIVEGDFVLGEDGRPVKVIKAHPPQVEQAYRLGFSDGSTMVAGESHLWKTMTAADRDRALRLTDAWRAKRRAKRKSRATGRGLRPHVAAMNAARAHAYHAPPPAAVRTTKEIVESLYVKRGVMVANHSIENPAPLVLRHADLPVPPYTLGAWLGDGATGSGRFAGIDNGIFKRIEADGFRVTDHAAKESHTIVGLIGKLRAAGVLTNKRIPPVYLRASAVQRQQLLQGLMDTDGWCEKDGSCKIALCKKDLFDGVVELIRTFGIQVRVSSGFKRATNGKPGNATETWTATFVSTYPVFCLKRKATRQNMTPQGRWLRRFIVSAEPVGPVKMRCLTVDSTDGMYLAGEHFVPTHNTDFLVMACVAQLALCHTKWLATKRKQRGRYIIFRKNVKNLADIIQRAEELYPVIDPGAKYNVVDKRWTFSSGYKVDFAHLDGPDDHRGYNGQEITGIGIDQVEEIAEEVYLFLRIQVRSKFEDMRKLLFVRVTANPGGAHAAWVKRYFVEGCKPHNTVIKSFVKLRNGKKKETTKAFVPATLYDNKYLAEDGAYEATLLSMPEHLRRMYLEGDWDVVIGAYFANLWSRAIHVIPSFSIPGHWPIKFGLDWGTTAPACTLWGTRDNDGNVYIIDELWRPGITGRTYGAAMLKRLELQKWSVERKWTAKDMYGLIDRQAMAATAADVGSGGSATPAAGIQWCGWRIFPANKDRAAGNEQVLERLLKKPNGRPSLFIFGDRCPNLIRTLPVLMSDPRNPEDVDPDAPDDHAFDALKYLLLDWPVQGTRPKDKQGDQDVERWLAMAARRKELAESPGDTITTGYGD